LRGRIFYGWFIVAAGAVAQLLVGGLHHYTYGAYVVLLERDEGWSKTSLSAAYSMARLENGFLGPLEGWLVDRFGPRLVMSMGMLTFGGGFIVLSQVDSILAFLIAFGCLALGAGMSSFMPLSVAVVNWFNRKRTTALATMQVGYALGGLAVPIVILSLETFGWRTTAFASGVLVIVIGLPLAQVVRHRPEDYGLQVDGGLPKTPDGVRDVARRAPQQRDFRPREALRTRAFWLISLGHGSALLVVSAVTVHLVPHLHQSLGYPLPTAGLVVTLMTLMQLAGIVAGGFLGDRFSKRIIAACCLAAHALGLLLVAFATSLPMVVGFAVLHGLAWGVRGPLMASIRADYFGRAAFGVIVGLSSMITTFGNTLGPIVAGVLADNTGSYQVGLTVLALLSGLGSVFFLMATKPRPPALSVEPSPVDKASARGRGRLREA
jgi:MFS family permease